MASKIYKTLVKRKIDNFINTFSFDAESLFKNNQRLIHPGEYGAYREKTFKELLRLLLNKDKSISDGFIITSDDCISTQCDVIIYNTNALPIIDENIGNFYPIEEVNAVIEIKSNLSYNDFKIALKKLAKIKMMARKRCGLLEKKRVFMDEMDDIATYLICKKINFDLKKINLKDIYENVPIRYWHNGVLSLEDGYLGYEMIYNDITPNMRITIQDEIKKSMTGKKTWEYPVHLEDDEIYFCGSNFLKINKKNKYQHIMEFLITLEVNLKLMNIYSMDSIQYLGFEVKEKEETIMKKCVDEIDREKIMFLNQKLGTKHRTKPYNPNNKEDIKTLLKLAVCRYLDYFKYWGDLAEIDELFDESIEYFDTDTWVNLSGQSKKGNKMILDAISSLTKAERSFRKLMESAEVECKELFSQVLNMENDIKNEIFGVIFEYDEAIINSIFEEIHELEYQYNMEDAYDMFIKFVNTKFSECVKKTL